MPKSKGRTSTEGRSGRYHLEPSASSRPSFHHGSLSSADSGSLSHFNASFSHPSSPLLTSNQVILESVLCLMNLMQCNAQMEFFFCPNVTFDYPDCCHNVNAEKCGSRHAVVVVEVVGLLTLTITLFFTERWSTHRSSSRPTGSPSQHYRQRARHR